MWIIKNQSRRMKLFKECWISARQGILFTWLGGGWYSGIKREVCASVKGVSLILVKEYLFRGCLQNCTPFKAQKATALKDREWSPSLQFQVPDWIANYILYSYKR